MPSGNTSLCLKRHARGIASRHMLRLFFYSSLFRNRHANANSLIVNDVGIVIIDLFGVLAHIKTISGTDQSGPSICCLDTRSAKNPFARTSSS